MAYHKLNQLLRTLPSSWWQHIKRGIRIQLTESEKLFLELLEQHPEWDDQQLRSALQQQGIQTDLRALRHKVYTRVLQIGTYVLMGQDKQSAGLFNLVLSRFAFVGGQDNDALKAAQKTYRTADIAGDPVQKLAAAVLQLEYHSHRNFQLFSQGELSQHLKQLQEALDQTQRFVQLLDIHSRWNTRYVEGNVRASSAKGKMLIQPVIDQLQRIPAYMTDPFPIPFLRWNTEALLWGISGQPARAVECYEQLIQYFQYDSQRPQLYPLAYFNALHNQIIYAAAARDAHTIERRFETIKQLRRQENAVAQSNEIVRDEVEMLYLNVVLYLALELGLFEEIFAHRQIIEQILQQYHRRYPYFYKAALYHLGCIAFWLQEYDLARQYLEAAYDHTSQRLLQQIGFLVRLLLSIIAWEQRDFEATERALGRLYRFVQQYPSFVPVVRVMRRILQRIPSTVAASHLSATLPFYQRIHRILSEALEQESIEFDILTWLEAKAAGMSITEYYQQKRQQEWEEGSGRMPALTFLQWHELVAE